MDISRPPRRVHVFSHPRSACHLFFQLLGSHPSFQKLKHLNCSDGYCLASDFQSSYPRENWKYARGNPPDESIAGITWQSVLDGLQQNVFEAETKGKCPIALDHPVFMMSSSTVNAHISVPGRETKPIPVVVDRMLDTEGRCQPPGSSTSLAIHRNPTLLPDRFFFSFTPIITIRHPARIIPSYARAMHAHKGELFDTEFPVMAVSFRLERLIFESFKSFEEARAAEEGRDVRIPIVVDGEKLVKDPHGQMKKVCTLLGIDEEGIKYTWDPPKLRENANTGKTFFAAINQSTGVVADDRFDKPLDIQEEAQKWVEEWDEPTAVAMEKMVASAMEDYEYLYQFSL
ncbi:hypothetical protein V5O48_006813 [Marasmius crinis-equi]|uniref:P-loop containing nucleoside triphosphate hydrolase protein n=1 Tax=Marasmius crinis-equi TaxID=585013 RepID=A0ABR3FIF2_9AGAR